MTRLFTVLDAVIDGFIRWVILPVTGVIPVLVRTGILFLLFAALWVAFVGAIVVRPSLLDEAWAGLGGLPLAAQGVAWLLFLPLTGALWIWSFDWPLVVRVVVVLGIAGWNLRAFAPQRTTTAPVPPATPASAEPATAAQEI